MEPGREEREEKCKIICAACQLLDPCREFALVNKEEWGIWGGMTEGERRQFRKWCRKWGFDEVPPRPVLDFLLDFFLHDDGPGPISDSSGNGGVGRPATNGVAVKVATNGSTNKRQHKARSA